MLPLFPGFDIVQKLDKPFIREGDIRKIQGLLEQRSHILVFETGDAAADSGEEETVHRMLPGVFDEIVNVRFDVGERTVHRGNCVALTLRSHSVAPFCAKMIIGIACRSAHV